MQNGLELCRCVDLIMFKQVKNDENPYLLKMNNIRNKNTFTETNIHLLFTPSENVYVLVGERGASSRHQVNTSSPACYKITVLWTLILLTGMCVCFCGGRLTRPSSLSSRARTPVLSVKSFTLTDGSGWVVVKSPWVPHLKNTSITMFKNIFTLKTKDNSGPRGPTGTFNGLPGLFLANWDFQWRTGIIYGVPGLLMPYWYIYGLMGLL